LNPNWEVVETAGKMKSVEIFLTFMIVGANRNVLLSKYSRISARQRARMNTFWGDPSWQEAAYKEQRSLFHDMDKLLKQPNIEIANAYKKRLLEVAGFKYVPDPIPMKTTTGSVMYYLFFATHNEIGAKIIRSIFKKYRTAGIIYGN
jgi:three-Cys-motif partner protein